MHHPEVNLLAIARETLLRWGFLIEPPRAALAQLGQIQEPDFDRLGVKDLSNLLWSSIDNDDSRDLDQIEYLETGSRGTRLLIAIADVTSLVDRGSALDQAARYNTTSIYTGVRTFPMFPDRLSTDLTSLLERQKLLAMVVDMLCTKEGCLAESSVYPAIVCNQFQLTYNAVAAWLDGHEGNGSAVTNQVLGKIRSHPPLQQQLQQQHELAESLRRLRLQAGALTFETIELRPELTPEGRWDLKAGGANSATRLIEDFMIAANQATVRFLETKSFPTLRRVVRTPTNWSRIVEIAVQRGSRLPSEPDAKALEGFLAQERQKDPERFPDLSLAVIKLLGRGEYTVASPSAEAPGHFALAVESYAHSTAPNRRYPDIITQRLLHAAVAGNKCPYSLPDLNELASHCTQKETDANKAERSVHKSIAAAALADRIGEKFPGMITGAAEKGVWVRIVHPPIEGRVEGAPKGLAVGDRVMVKLVSTDPWRGYIDFQFLALRNNHGTS